MRDNRKKTKQGIYKHAKCAPVQCVNDLDQFTVTLSGNYKVTHNTVLSQYLANDNE